MKKLKRQVESLLDPTRGHEGVMFSPLSRGWKFLAQEAAVSVPNKGDNNVNVLWELELRTQGTPKFYSTDKCFLYMNSFICAMNPHPEHDFSHFIDKETKAQRDKSASPRWHTILIPSNSTHRKGGVTIRWVKLSDRDPTLSYWVIFFFLILYLLFVWELFLPFH